MGLSDFPPPAPGVPAPPAPPTPPPVVRWFKVYCGAMAALYLFCIAAGVAFLIFGPTLAKSPDDPPAAFWIAYGGIFSILGATLAAAFAAALFLKPKPWVWVYSVVLICLGMTSACCLPASIPLLLYWFKPEVQRTYGRGAS